MQAGLIRQAIGIAVDKAVQDVEGNARRGVRNLIDLGLMFSRGENQKWFFETARKVIDNPKNPYNALVARAVREIDNQTIRKVGINLGYNALSLGARQIRSNQEALGFEIPWVLALDAPSGAELALRFAPCAAEGRDMGIYSYVLCLRDGEGLSDLIEGIKALDDCFFMLRIPAALVDERAADIVARAHNLAVAVRMNRADAPEAAAFRLLRERKCLYGYSLTYGQEDLPRVISQEFVMQGIESGCLFGAYAAAASASRRSRERVHAFACRERGENGRPLIALDWPRDIVEIGERMEVGSVLSINLAEKEFSGCRSGKSARCSLAELFQRAQVCLA